MIDTELLFGDCLQIMPKISKKIDAIITDLPYKKTQCEWDEIISIDRMWELVNTILKPGGVFITTAVQPFASMLVLSNLGKFKYEIIWIKDRTTGHLNANRMPLRKHENILIFCENKTTYNPQITKKNSEKYTTNKPQKTVLLLRQI